MISFFQKTFSHDNDDDEDDHYPNDFIHFVCFILSGQDHYHFDLNQFDYNLNDYFESMFVWLHCLFDGSNDRLIEKRVDFASKFKIKYH